MSWNPNEFSEYNDETSGNIDYSNPSYYQQEVSKTARSAQPAQYPDPSALHSDYAHELPSDKLEYEGELMSPDRGPAGIEGYTDDIGAVQR